MNEPFVYYYKTKDGKGVGMGTSIPDNAEPISEEDYHGAIAYNTAVGAQTIAEWQASHFAKRQALADALAEKLGMSADEITTLLR